MNLILKGRGGGLDDRARAYATEKLTRSQRFFERIIKMEVDLSTESNPRVKDDHKVEVTVKTPRETLRAHGAGSDWFSAIDQAADRLDAQVKKMKAKMNHRSHRPDPSRLKPMTVEEPPERDGEAEIIRTSQMLVKPMTPEEAALEIEARNLYFALFTNAETMRAAVLYHRSDGSYGLIEHEG